nr:hypothetical protein [Tanacetum cinerariifolium]
FVSVSHLWRVWAYIMLPMLTATEVGEMSCFDLSSQVDPVGDFGYLKPEGNSGGVSTGVIGPDGFNTESLYYFYCCENSHEASECESDVAHGGGGCDPIADHSGCYRWGGNHRARECLIGNNRGGGGSRCYNCGKGGHYARDCPTGNSRRGGVGSACYNCGERW